MSPEETKVNGETVNLRDTGEVPLLLEDGVFSEIFPEGKTPVIFLDFDGTLSPIVNHPEDAALARGMEDILRRCASKYTIAVVSGRDMDDVKGRVNIDEIIYAGSHGFRISGPDGLIMEQKKAEKILPLLDRIKNQLNEKFSAGPEGVQVERKRYAIAVHFRNVEDSRRHEVQPKIDEVLKDHSGVKTGTGKMIIEIKPDLDWHKGKAIEWILDELNLNDNPEIMAIYIGDDVTDEDAFKTILPNGGVGILVGTHGNPTAAAYRLKNVDEVKVLLQKLYERA